jgi:YD repeat-containing protein
MTTGAIPVATQGASQSSTTDYEQYGYDPVGNRTSLRKRDGRTIGYSYDALNRLRVKSVPASASGAAGYSVYSGYDVRGLMTHARFGSDTGAGITNAYVSAQMVVIAGGAVIPGADVAEAIANGAGPRGIAIAVALEAPGLKQVDKALDAAKAVKTITVSASKSPQAAQHLVDAGATGAKLTVDRGGAAARRADALSGTPTKPGLDRDEVPPAVFGEGGAGSSVRHIDSSDNRSAGAQIGNQLRDVPDGGCVRIEICD